MWQFQGACRSAPLDLVDAMFDLRGKEGRSAKAKFINQYCRRCQVSDTCLDYAWHNPEHGVWGGATAKTRSKKGGARVSHVLGERG